MKVWGLFLVLLMLPLHTAWGQTTKKQQVVAMEAILAELETHYGMTEYKEKMFGVSLDGLRHRYTRLINEARTLEEDSGLDQPVTREVLPVDEFRQLMIGMVAELRDGHANISRQTSHLGTLGLNAAAIGENLYVTEVRKDLMAQDGSGLPIEAGDEILELDGVPVQQLALRNLLYIAAGTFEDRWIEAMESIVINPQFIMRPRKEGAKAVLKLRKGDQIYTANLRWTDISDYATLVKLYPKVYPNRAKVLSQDAPVVFGMRGTTRSYFRTGLLNNPEMKDSLIDVGAIMNHEIEAAQELAKQKIAGVPDAQDKMPNPTLVNLQPVSRLMIYMVRHNGKNLGVLRLPSYSPGGMDAIRNEYLWIAEGLRRLEKLTDGLIIDQVSNTGGSVYYVTRLLSLFASKDKPLQTMMANHKLNETFLQNMAPDVSADPIYHTSPQYLDLKLYSQFYKDLRAKWERGEQWSGLVPAMDLQSHPLENTPGEIFPAKEGVYSHPILLLNDARSGSGGDFVPRLFQQNGRATVYGETSCGLGGSVYRRIDSMPGSEMSFRCTTAYFESPDGWPLENIGTVPDIARPIQIEDLQNGFRSYSLGVLNKAAQLASGEKSENAVVTTPKTELAQMAQRMREAGDDVYPEMGAALLAQAGQIPLSDWESTSVPLPKSLLEDPILKTVYKRLDVLNRLQEMRNLPRWKDSEGLIDAAIKIASQLPAHFASPCELRLRMQPLKGAG